MVNRVTHQGIQLQALHFQLVGQMLPLQHDFLQAASLLSQGGLHFTQLPLQGCGSGFLLFQADLLDLRQNRGSVSEQHTYKRIFTEISEAGTYAAICLLSATLCQVCKNNATCWINGALHQASTTASQEASPNTNGGDVHTNIQIKKPVNQPIHKSEGTHAK